jgi:hypothetical protein
MIVFLLRFWYFFLGEMFLLIHGRPRARRTKNGRKIRDYYQSKWMKFPYPPEPDL